MFDLTDDQKDLRDKARRLAEGAIAERAAEVDRTEEYPWDNVALLKDAGFMGMTIPEAYGGQGRSFLDAVLVVEGMAKQCGVTGRIVVEANMGAISAVMRYGSEEQKKLCAEHVLAGDKPAICITEPNAGSAATDMTTRADKVGDNGGGVSKVHLIFARVFETARNRASAASWPSATNIRAWSSARANRPWACAAFRNARSISMTWKCTNPWP